MHYVPLMPGLAYAGMLPFVACAILASAGVDAIPVLGSTSHIAASYALVITVFMAGIHWGTAVYKHTDVPMNLFVQSNVVTLVAWFGYLLASNSVSLLICAVALTYLLWLDRRLHLAELLSATYLTLRFRVTTVVVVALLITALAG